MLVHVGIYKYTSYVLSSAHYIWDKVFKRRLSKFCGRQTLKNLISPLLNTLLHISDIGQIIDTHKDL